LLVGGPKVHGPKLAASPAVEDASEQANSVNRMSGIRMCVTTPLVRRL